MKKSLLFLTVVITVSMNAQTFIASEDVFVKGGSLDTNNYNSVDGEENPMLEVKIGSNEEFFRKTLIKFNLTKSGLSGSDVTDAKLRLRVADVQKKTADPATITVSGTTDDSWLEKTVFYSDAPVSGAALSTVIGITGTDRPDPDGDGMDGADKYWESQDFIDYVKTELDGDQIISFVLEDLGTANNTVTFLSKAVGVDFAPQLIINNDTTLSASDFILESDVISLYPNPAQASFVINSPKAEISNVKIFSINGSLLFNNENVNSNSLKINSSSFQSGIYFAHVKMADGTNLVKKITKK